MISALGRLLLDRGCAVSGSDLKDSPQLTRLRGAGAKVAVGHSPANVPARCDLVIASSAVPDDNLELVEARRRGLAVWDKGRALAALMSGQKGIGVAGTHGKTTTTAMVGLALAEAGLDPTVLIGGELDSYQGNVRIGRGRYFVAETDESDSSFLKLSLDTAVVTNVERDHLDHYHTFERLVQAFRQFLAAVPDDGAAVVCAEDPRLSRLAAQARAPLVTYGLGPEAEVRGVNLRLLPKGSVCEVVVRGSPAGEMTLNVPGKHNVLDALAAASVAFHAGAPWPDACRALAGFRGVRRRFERKGSFAGVTVLDDYGHHPTEVRATLEAARRAAGGRLICVFQPHRYTRTRSLCYEFGESFDLADRLILMDIYPAGEKPLPGVSAQMILDAVSSCGRGPAAVERIPDHDGVIEKLAGTLRPGDTVLTIGAGDVHRVGEGLLRKLSSGEERRTGPPGGCS
jgi:UDP-N-acetylmuramate--alanine ligase